MTQLAVLKHWNAANEFCICYDVFNVTWSMSHVIDFNILFKQLGTFRSVPLHTYSTIICRISFVWNVLASGSKKVSRNNRCAFCLGRMRWECPIGMCLGKWATSVKIVRNILSRLTSYSHKIIWNVVIFLRKKLNRSELFQFVQWNWWKKAKDSKHQCQFYK